MKHVIPKFFVTGLFVMALLGALMTSSLDRDYHIGGITAHAIYDDTITQSSVQVEGSSGLAIFGFILAAITIIALVVIGYLAIEMHQESEEDKVGLKGVVHLDREIDEITKELQKLD